MICESKVGCFIGNVYVGALAYADDLALVAPSARAMRLLSYICDEYGKKFSIKFNAVKSARLYVGKRKQHSVCIPQFSVGGDDIPWVSQYTHLSHIISDNLDDKSENTSKRNSLCSNINNVLCYFYKQDPIVKQKLLWSYCADFYGSVLWDVNHPSVEDVCIAWSKGLKRIWQLPLRTHSGIVAPIYVWSVATEIGDYVPVCWLYC